ncbi:DUF6286 domain-containing protein [Brachybacterium sp. YJGR34]|uniref:DUF6286 domain-containing protein n=1 Tax=Brachybacterium sp. YJGR34 TaxID=2059911 RepID=UPI000E0B1AAE|nr:DUF6286 domain-containing protein [Brachybacterium sp. YJGR34]
MSTAPARLARRPARSVPAAVLALLAIAAGGTGLWLFGSFLLDGAWPAAAAEAVSAVGATRLDSTPILIGAGLLGLLGLLLALSGIAPGDPGRRAILADDVPGQTAVSRRDLAHRVQRRIEHVDGVRDARVSVRRRRVDVLVRTPLEDTATVARRTRAEAEAALASLRPSTPLRPRVRTAHLR